MESNKGITLTSLIIYVIVFTIVVTTVTAISGYFTKNTDEIVISASSSEQYTRLTTYLSNDINSINFENMEIEDYYIKVIFKDNSYHKYLYDNNKIYYISEKNEYIGKKINLCNKIDDCRFIHNTDNNKLNISIMIEGITYNSYYSI